MAEQVMDRQAQGYERKLQQIFVAVGVLPILLVIAVVLFSLCCARAPISPSWRWARWW